MSVSLLRAVALACLLAAAPARAQDPAPTTDADLKWSIDFVSQGLTSSHPFWGLAQTFAPTAGYDTSYTWFEAYLRPALAGERRLDANATLYGGVSLIGSATLGDDLFQQGDTGRLSLDDAFLGAKRLVGDGAQLDVSLGAQRYVLGHGLLLAAGAGNGFERGAATLAPRRAWEMTAVARAGVGPTTIEAFYLDPNELKSADTGTKLAGGRIEWSQDPSLTLGAAWISAIGSLAPYPKAPIQIIEGGRDGLRTTDLYWRWAPTSGALAGLSFTGEAAFQRNDRISMRARGYGAELAYVLPRLPFSPRISWSPRYFSGDEPGTADTLERFDPLFYDGAPNTWSSGGNGSFAFYNSNLRVDRFRIDLTLSPADFVNLNYWNVRAAQVNSPIQYGQAARIVSSTGGYILVTGVPERALSQEFYVEYTRVLSRHWFLTAGVTVALPDDGVEALVPTGAKTWFGGLFNLSYRH